eukprot:gene9047-biopygen22682
MFPQPHPRHQPGVTRRRRAATRRPASPVPAVPLCRVGGAAATPLNAVAAARPPAQSLQTPEPITTTTTPSPESVRPGRRRGTSLRSRAPAGVLARRCRTVVGVNSIYGGTGRGPASPPPPGLLLPAGSRRANYSDLPQTVSRTLSARLAETNSPVAPSGFL